MATLAGTLRGDFSIDSNGGAVYRVPLAVPLGTAGLAPSLSVAYNSGGGNDILGVGWSLQGLSVIMRVPATVATDGFVGAVRFDEHDRFAIDGQRLVAIRGTYGAADAEYRTASDSVRRIVPAGDGFRVFEKDGRVHEYGTTADARAAAAPHPATRMWALNRTTDRHGNTLTVRYANLADGNLYPDQIDYTGNPAAGAAPRRAVRFAYADRPDKPRRYLSGATVSIAHLLASVKTFVDGALVTSYEFEYAAGASTGRSTLRSITQRDAAGDALTPTVFEWRDGNDGIYRAAEPLAPTHLHAGASLVPMDIDGDGFTDLVVASPSRDGMGRLELSVLMAAPERSLTGSRFEPPRALPATGMRFGGLLLPMDVDGDGAMDLVYAVNDGGRLGLTVFHARQADGVWTLLREGEPNAAGPHDLRWGGHLLSGDVDGDGRADLVYVVNDGGTLTIHTLFSDGRRFAESGAGPQRTTLRWSSRGQVIPLDFDGDGRTDLIYAGGGANGLALARLASRGRDGFAQLDAEPVARGCPFGGTLMPMDLNADGNVDLVYARIEHGMLQLQPLVCDGSDFHVREPFSTGIRCTPEDPPTLLPAEVNGDGMPDLVVASRDANRLRLDVFLTDGESFMAAPSLRQPFAVPHGGFLLPLDLDGDGRSDLCYAIASAGVLSFSHALAAGRPPDLITAITNGFGGRVEIDYLPMTDRSVYRKEAVELGAHVEAQSLVGNAISGAAFHDLPSSSLGGGTAGAVYSTRSADFPKQLVAAHRIHDGRGNVDAYEHAYAGAKFDLSGRGWLGFASVESRDVRTGITSVSEYNQESSAVPAALNQTLRATTTMRTADRAWLNRVAYAYEARRRADGVFQNLPLSVETSVYSAVPAGSPPDLVQRKTIEYDEHGNPTLTADESSDGGAPLYVFESYEPADEARWLIGFKREMKMAGDRAGQMLLAHERLTYGGAGHDIVRREIWHDQQSRWLVTTYDYDAFGNEIALTDPAGATWRKVYDDFHTFVAEEHTPPAAQGRAIVATTVWDARFGHAIGKSAGHFDGTPARIVAATTLDGFGRVAETRGLAPSGALEPVTRRSWSRDGNGAFEELARRVSWHDDAWSWKRTYIDGNGRHDRITELGPDGARAVSTERRFDARGNVVRQTLAHYENESAVAIERLYDEHGRPVQETTPNPDGSLTLTQIRYPNATTSVRVDAAGTALARTTTERFATFRRRSSVVERIDAAGATTRFTFDALGRPLTAVDPNGVATIATYDSCGRQSALQIREGNDVILDEHFVVDDAARIRKEIATGGRSIATAYDLLGRPTSKTTDAGTTRFDYDAADAPGLPRRASMPDGSVYDLQHDAAGRQTAITITLGGVSQRLSRSVTPLGAVETLTFPDGAVQTNDYNAAGTLTAIRLRENGGAETRHVAYEAFDAAGAPRRATYGNGVREEVMTAPTGQLLGKRVVGPDGATLLDEAFRWNGLGLLDAVDDHRDPGRSQHFDYDTVGRLSLATGSYPRQVFGYDAAGNLIARNDVHLRYRGYQLQEGIENGNRVVAAEYDAAGNMTALRKRDVSRRYAYDAERRLVSCGGTTYAYDYTGRRIAKQIDGGAKTWFVTRGFEVTVLPDGRRQRTKSIAGPFGVVAAVTEREGGGPATPDLPAPGTVYFHRNQIDSTVLHTDAAGRAAGRIEYLPYGEVYRAEGSDAVRLKFTGKELDAESGLYYFESRYYDPFTGRFTSADDRLGASLREPDALNRYAYVLNNPVSNTDPSGHGFFDDIVPAIAPAISHAATFVGNKVAEGAKKFGNAAATAFSSRAVSLGISFVIDAGLTVAGIAVLATAPFGGPASIMLGNTLLGGGIGGFSYSIQVAATGGGFNWGAWGTQVGIGAAAGLVMGGFSAVGAELGTAGLIAAETLGGAAGGVVGQLLQNVAAHQSLATSLGTATLYGAGAALLGTAGGRLMRSSRLRVYSEAERLTAEIHFQRELPKYAELTLIDRGLIKTPGVLFKGASWVGQQYWYPAW